MTESSDGGRMHLWMAGGAIAAAIALVAYGATRPSTPSASPRCDPSRIDEVWAGSQATAVQRAFEATESDVAAASFAMVRRDLDSYAQTWRTAITQVCDADATLSERDHAGARQACLQDRLASLRAWVNQLREATERTVEVAPFAVALGLPPIADCGVARQRDGSADDDETMGQRLDAVQARLQLGDAEAARAQLEPLVGTEPEPGDAGTARALALLGQALLAEGAYEQAAATLEQSMWTALEAGDDPLAMRAALDLALAQANQGEHFDRAQRWWRLASALATRMGPAPHRDSELLHAQAELLRMQGRFKAALQIYERSLVVAEQRFGSLHPVLSIGLHGAALAAARLGRAPEAMTLQTRADELIDEQLGNNHPKQRQMHRSFGLALLVGGSAQEGADYLGRSLQGLDDEVSRQDVQAAIALGRALSVTAEPAAARQAFERAADLFSRAGLQDPSLAADLDLGLGLAYLQGGNPIAALERFHAAAQHQRSAGDSAALADTLTRMGKTLADLGRVSDGVAALEEAAKIVESLPTASPRTRAEAWLALAEGRLQQGRPAEALTLARGALELWADIDAAHPSSLDALSTIGTAALALGRPKDAVAAFEQAASLAESSGAPPARRASALLGLATALWRDGRRDQALARITEVRALVEEIGDDQVLSLGDVDAWLQRRGLSM